MIAQTKQYQSSGGMQNEKGGMQQRMQGVGLRKDMIQIQGG